MIPGVYQMSFRGLSLREAWRFSKRNPLLFLVAMVLKLVGMRGALQRLPTERVEVPCREADLSPSARTHLLPVVQQARDLGYADHLFTTLNEILDPNTLEAFACLLLHRDRRRALYAGFLKSKADGAVKDVVTVTGALATIGEGDFEFADHDNYLDPPRGAHIVRLRARGVDAIDRAMQKFAGAHDVRAFSGFADMRRYALEAVGRACEDRIARGLFVLKERD